MNRGSIHLHIDELVLDGFDPAGRHQIADAVERELAMLLADDRVRAGLVRGLTLEHADAGTFTVADSNSSRLGSQIARALSGSVLGALRMSSSLAAHPEGSPYPSHANARSEVGRGVPAEPPHCESRFPRQLTGDPDKSGQAGPPYPRQGPCSKTAALPANRQLGTLTSRPGTPNPERGNSNLGPAGGHLA